MIQIGLNHIFLISLYLISLLGVVVLVKRLIGVAGESFGIKRNAVLLVSGRAQAAARGSGGIRRKGIGLRLKLVFFTMVMVLAVVIMVSVPLYYIIADQIPGEQEAVINVILIVAASALIIGNLGAWILSTLIIQPIKKLVRHVELIRDTEDKTRLKGHDIYLNSRDELAVLGNTINDMTRELAKASATASDLSVARELQKKFLPLEHDKNGNKLSHSFRETEFVSFFAYYEGASGVSGDYFDFKDLDGRHYAIIKCDVAGLGIPAALIMVQVATMFLNYFKDWDADDQGMGIDTLAYQINNFIEPLAFENRFAAFALCIFDSHTGKLRFCNAGDNKIHYYDASERQLKIVTLPESPAAGILPKEMIESVGGYRIQTMTLDRGDILLLYTDGIEESKRKFRNRFFEEIVCTEAENGRPHENHVAGLGDEDMGFERVRDIVNSVMNRQIYRLHKWHNPEGDDKDLHFDFRSTRGRIDELIMALVSAEKMFRSYKDPRASRENLVQVDRIIDTFLAKHFVQYRNYCSLSRKYPGNNEYLYYTHLYEDQQYDDITILGIKRK